MKNVILFILLSALANNTLEAMNKAIVLPSHEVLNSRLCSLELGHFARETKIHERLGGQTLRPVNIVKTLNSTLDDYCKGLQNEAFVHQIEISRPEIIGLFFQERPEIVSFLEEMGWLDSRESRSNY